MNKTVLVTVAILGGIGLFLGGVFVGQANTQAIQPGWMTGNFEGQYGTDIMNGPGMMGNWSGQTVPGMMNGRMMGMMMNGSDRMGYGMMGGYASSTNADPLTIEEAETAVNNYLATLNNDNLGLGEVMIFDSHAYAQIVDESRETGAFEVLVDPITGNVYPEPGPNMMWNNEYGMMGGYSVTGMMGNHMMGHFGYAPEGTINVTAEDAIVIAQNYLNEALPGKTADDRAEAFPGYYTIHVLEDGEVLGMLSVHVTTGQVFLHHWHGDFVETSDLDHE